MRGKHCAHRGIGQIDHRAVTPYGPEQKRGSACGPAVETVRVELTSAYARCDTRIDCQENIVR